MGLAVDVVDYLIIESGLVSFTENDSPFTKVYSRAFHVLSANHYCFDKIVSQTRYDQFRPA
jgi:hypothetical protein